jgi:NAD(P)-dependent dehydrogenase (short-subunit alcohol dehydrogenase family)
MAGPTTVLITGANRGLGRGLLERYLARPNHIVIAGNRDPAHATSRSLADLPRGDGSRLVVLKIDASVEEDAFAAMKELESTHGVDRLDVVIANAGVSYIQPSVADVKLKDFRAHMVPNVEGVISLYQATRGFMKKASETPIFAPVGSSAGLIG